MFTGVPFLVPNDEWHMASELKLGLTLWNEQLMQKSKALTVLRPLSLSQVSYTPHSSTKAPVENVTVATVAIIT